MCFLFPLVLFNWQTRKYILFIAPLSILVPITLFIVAIYHKLPTRAIIYILFEAQKMEIVEFMSGLYFWKFLIVIIPLTILLTAKKFIHSNKVISKKVRMIFVGFYMVLFLLTFVFKTIQRKILNNTLKASYFTFVRATPINTSVRFYKTLKAYKNSRIDNFSNRSLNVYRKTEVNSREIYILVLGESSRYRNWEINGYNRNTSPNLLGLNNIISYKNIISPSFSTNKSLPIILATKSAENFFTSVNHISIINIFKQSGFKTYWIGNQSIKGNVIGAIASASHEIFESDYKRGAAYDGELLPKISAILNRNEQKVFIIIHTWGSHYPYQKRYPETFKIFTPTIKKNQHIPLNIGHRDAIINSYDNSIVYTDYILSKLIDLINIDSAITSLTYLSDHGENLFDDENIGFGRGYGKFSPQLFQIPLFFWASNIYISNNSSKWQTLIKNDSAKCSTEGFIYTFSDLAGIYWDKYDSTQSFANKHYREKERFFLDKKKTVNYDKFFTKVPEKSN